MALCVGLSGMATWAQHHRRRRELPFAHPGVLSLKFGLVCLYYRPLIANENSIAEAESDERVILVVAGRKARCQSVHSLAGGTWGGDCPPSSSGRCPPPFQRPVLSTTGIHTRQVRWHQLQACHPVLSLHPRGQGLPCWSFGIDILKTEVLQ